MLCDNVLTAGGSAERLSHRNGFYLERAEHTENMRASLARKRPRVVWLVAPRGYGTRPRANNIQLAIRSVFLKLPTLRSRDRDVWLHVFGTRCVT